MEHRADGSRAEPECACEPAASIGAHFDAKVRRTASGVSQPHPTTRALLELLGAPDGRTVLELGCGRGGFLVEMLRKGAASVTGVELSAASIELARERIAATGLGERATLVVADAATLPLEPGDWVVLDRVICCYPDAASLVANSARAARSRYAFSVPDSQGWRGIAARVSRSVDNGWNRVRRRPCATFVHDLRDIERSLVAEGFERQAEARRGLWHVAVFERRDAARR